MRNKIFLTSALAMGVIAPAMAEPSNTGEFPSGGLMQEDYTYTNAATEANMGVYEGSVNATAEYDTIDYILTAGQYLPADSETITTCPAGSFCSGGTTVQYNQSSAQGIETCPTGYASSAAGSSSNTQCYRACDVNNMGENGSIANIAHATAISGNDYYGSGVDTCEPTDCEHGWRVKAAVPNLTNIIGVSEKGTKAVYKSVSGTGDNSSASDLSTYGITQNGEFVVDYSNKGKIHGRAQCSTREGVNIIWANTYNATDSNFTATLPNSSGQYCYCQLDGYTTAGGVVTALSAPWVFFLADSNASGCARNCAHNCVEGMSASDSHSLSFRAAVLGSVESSPAMCEANVININWSNADAADISANNAGTATYGSDVRTPVKAQTIKGKTFKGWRFSKPEQTTTGN